MNILNWGTEKLYEKFNSLFLQYGAVVNSVTCNSTLLHIAAYESNDRLCSLLIQHGALVDVDTYSSGTALNIAATAVHLYHVDKWKRLSTCLLLLRHGANLTSGKDCLIMDS